MYFSNIYGQFKIASEQLAKLDEQTAQDLTEVARGAGWDENSGSLHSPPIQLRFPAGTNGTAEQELAFPWPEGATQATALHAAQAQLLVFDVHGVGNRGQVQLRLSGHISDTDGQPLYLFKGVPRTLALRVARGIQDELKYLMEPASVLAYRIVHSDQDVRTTEFRATYFSRKKQIERVKCIQVYDHVLKRNGDRVLHEPKLRALYDVDDPKRQRHATTLGSSELRDLMLHGLSAHEQDFYAEVGNNERDQATPPTTQARKLYTLFRPEPVAVPPAAPPKVETPKKAKKTVSTAAPSPAPLLSELPSKTADVTGVGPTPLPLPGEPVAAPPPQPPPAPLIKPTDPWVALEEQVAVDAQVLRQARAALERRRPLLLRGAPGTGKTLLARGLAEALCGPGNYTLVTADARWTSADVIGGLRVAPGEGLRYAFSPGVVTRAAARHQESRDKTRHPHALIIDEFNRANQDEAFGRLLTLLDPVYRQGMPLVGPEDGAPDAVFLPEDFLLIVTMNDTDAARLHEIGAALSRRFASVRMGIPANERPFLMARFPEVPDASLEALYDFVGSGVRDNDLEGGRLRAFVPVGTYYVQEALVMLGQGLPLDAVLAELTGPLLPGLGRDALTALHGNAGRGHLAALNTLLEEALAQTHF